MDENYQDKTESKRTTTEYKLWLPPLSSKDQKKLDRLRQDRKKAKQSLIVVGISAVFVGVIVPIYIWFRFNRPLWVPISLILIGIVLLILLIRVGYTAQWTGLKGKTLWDWLNLLGTLTIPLVVVLATIGFGWWQSEGALDQQRATTLQTYMDNMQDLLLKYNLLGESPKSTNSSDLATIQEVRELARARTLTALRGLDPQRKGILLQFLYDAHLIGFPDNVFDTKTKKTVFVIHPAIIQLGGQGLDSADLSGTILGDGAFMTGVDLSFTNLRGADLSGVFFDGANLIGTHLEGANLSYTVLWDAAFSPYLQGTNLESAQLDGANLYDTNLSGIDMQFATLSCNGFSLLPSSCTDLSKTNITQQQLDQAGSCKGALLLKGLICHLSY